MTVLNTGSCLCEAVKYELHGKPVKCAVCHCDSCQQFSGSVFMANCWFKQNEFKIVCGRDSIQTYDERATVSGLTMKRSFCRICGSSLFQQTAQLQELGLVSVTSGTMDDRSDAQPTLEVWCRNRRQWLTLDHNGDKYETQ
ncbi:Mss4-like protein [Aspergillus pseudodeflectus]|uniref:Mss4-like protein n=1 Tax=Aspergillus pseudodeflectus TaxID=176178 RepID=A0ABR4KDP4_9EURO